MRFGRVLPFFGLGLVLVGCDPGGPTAPEGTRVEVGVYRVGEIETSATLRFALVWTYVVGNDHRAHVANDQPLPSLSAFPVQVELPPPSVFGRLAPVEQLIVGYYGDSTLLADVYRPRFVVYEDIDEDGRLGTDALNLAGPDRVLGVDDERAPLAAILDLESVLENLPFSRTEAFYTATDGGYSAFVTTFNSGSSLELSSWDPRVSVFLNDSDAPRQLLDCLRPTPTSGSAQEVYLGESVEPSICGLDMGVCDVVDLDALDPPRIPESKVAALSSLQCRQRGDLEALVVSDSTLECDDCVCTRWSNRVVYVADHSFLPEWWPCGGELPICDDEDGFIAHSATCEQQQLDRLADELAAASAGEPDENSR